MYICISYAAVYYVMIARGNRAVLNQRWLLKKIFTLNMLISDSIKMMIIYLHLLHKEAGIAGSLYATIYLYTSLLQHVLCIYPFMHYCYFVAPIIKTQRINMHYIVLLSRCCINFIQGEVIMIRGGGGGIWVGSFLCNFLFCIFGLPSSIVLFCILYSKGQKTSNENETGTLVVCFIWVSKFLMEGIT